jgi:DNA processing protein
MSFPGIGTARAIQLAEHFGSLSSLREAPIDSIIKITKQAGRSLQASIGVIVPPLLLPDGVNAVCKFDREWPTWAATMQKDPPAILYFRGTMPNIPCVAVVGTRQPTLFGQRAVQLLMPEIATRGWGVVSGLALGIDTIAHEEALKANVPTWAILGGGVDVPTPRHNLELAERILESGGGLISEQPPGNEPQPQSLVARNRLQVAASEIVFAAQSGIPSGTLHTVRFAIEQERLLVVPRPIDKLIHEAQSAGNVALTDPHGCDPAVIKATGALAVTVSERHPVADLVVGSNNLSEIWELKP